MTDTARLEKDIQAARARLEGTVNELAYRAQPAVIAQRQAQGLRLKLDAATHTHEGELRIERIAASSRPPWPSSWSSASCAAGADACSRTLPAPAGGVQAVSPGRHRAGG